MQNYVYFVEQNFAEILVLLPWPRRLTVFDDDDNNNMTTTVYDDTTSCHGRRRRVDVVVSLMTMSLTYNIIVMTTSLPRQ